MSQILLLGKLITRYKVWSMKLQTSHQNIKSNILQDDTSSLVEEKIISIAISSFIVYLGLGLLGLFGVGFGGFVAGALLFAIGWILSKFLNKKIFGTKREIEHLKSEERELFEKLDSVLQRHQSIREKINAAQILVNFTDYVSLKKEFEYLLKTLKAYDVKNLAYKYRLKYPLLVAKQKKIGEDFYEIYAHKKKRIQ